MNKLIDSYGRVHNYVRISVTDRCNLRCMYCMPPEGMPFMPVGNLLSYNEIAEAVSVLAEMGVTKVRLTGGEPLLRNDLDQLVGLLSSIRGIHDISLTTNGLYLESMVERLKTAGLTRVNISMDSLRADRFAMITRGGKLDYVMRGLNKCLELGVQPVKLNVVLMRGINDDEIVDFLKLSYDLPVQVRFIEYMPIGPTHEQWNALYVPLSEVMDKCSNFGWNTKPMEDKAPSGPASQYQILGGKGSFGLIHPISKQFCATCNRLRLTADGTIKPCLYWQEELNVRACNGDRDKLMEMFMQAMKIKAEHHEMAQSAQDTQHANQTARIMSQIGG